MKKILKKIKEYKNIVIFGHKRPDGDCIGSQKGLKSIIENTYKGKHAYVVGQEADYLEFLGPLDDVSIDIIRESLAIVVDCATTERISDDRYQLAKEVIRIDHHLNTEEYGDICYVEKSPATAQILANMLIINKLKIDEKGAIALYTGLVTDTGRFRYEGTEEKTHQVAAYLVSKGAVPSIIDKMLSIESFNTLRIKGYVLDNMIKTDGGFLYCILERKTIKEYGVTDEAAANTVNMLANVKDCPVWALFIEYDEEIRVRLRSIGPRIDLLANKYDGGGHYLASGASIKSFAEVETFAKDVDELIKETNNL